VEEDTAVIIKDGMEGKVTGSGTVIRIDGSDIEGTNMKNFTENQPFSVRNLKVDILAPGDTFHIEQRNPPHK
jgi:cyanophycinase